MKTFNNFQQIQLLAGYIIYLLNLSVHCYKEQTQPPENEVDITFSESENHFLYFILFPV